MMNERILDCQCRCGCRNGAGHLIKVSLARGVRLNPPHEFRLCSTCKKQGVDLANPRHGDPAGEGVAL